MRNPARPRIRRHLVVTIGVGALALLGVITFQWCWNTLAELFDGPVMEFRHALAALLLAATASAAFAGPGRRQAQHQAKRPNRHET